MSWPISPLAGWGQPDTNAPTIAFTKRGIFINAEDRRGYKPTLDEVVTALSDRGFVVELRDDAPATYASDGYAFVVNVDGRGALAKGKS